MSLDLVLASLQKEVRAVNDNMKKLKKELAQLATNTGDVGRFGRDLKNLKNENPTLNT